MDNYKYSKIDMERKERFNLIKQEFEHKANIDGKLLKDIWNEVSFAGYMFCG